VYNNGSYYEGEWRDDAMEGYGKLYYTNGNIAYEGHWKNGCFSGTGKLHNDTPNLSLAQEPPIDYRDLSTVKDRWVWYEGQFEKDEREGKGTIRFVNGERFNGTFVRDSA
jgi:hypothetical protein